MPVSEKVKRIIWAQAAGRCSFPDCPAELVMESDSNSPSLVGEVAHIVGEKPDAARGDSPLSEEQRNQPDNLMLLCPTHHTQVDNAPQTYSVERLHGFKLRHLNWVRETLGRRNFAHCRIHDDPETASETVHSTLLSVDRLPLGIYSAPPRTTDPAEIKKEATWPAPFILHSGHLITFDDLKSPDNAFQQIVNHQQATRDHAPRWWDDPDKCRLYVYLLSRCLNKITGRLGLMLDRKRKRYCFACQEPGQPRKTTYRPMNQKSSEISVVWQPIQKSRGEPYGYWLHRAISFRFLRIMPDQWVISLRPEYHVTSDGQKDYESSEIGAKVTHKKARMYNDALLHEIHFWRDFLSEGDPRITYRCGSQALVIGTTLLQSTIAWPGVPGDSIPFRNIQIPETLFSLHDDRDILEDEIEDEDEWPEHEDIDDEV